MTAPLDGILQTPLVGPTMILVIMKAATAGLDPLLITAGDTVQRRNMCRKDRMNTRILAPWSNVRGVPGISGNHAWQDPSVDLVLWSGIDDDFGTPRMYFADLHSQVLIFLSNSAAKLWYVPVWNKKCSILQKSCSERQTTDTGYIAPYFKRPVLAIP